MLISVSIRPYKPLLLASCLAALVACSGSSDTELLASARGYLAKSNNPSAIIELRNLLQQNPGLREGRFLLGKTLLETGDAAGAEVQLQRALDAGQPDTDVLPLLAKAMIALNKSTLLVQQYGSVDLKDDVAAAEFQTQLALAYINQQAPGKAEAAVAKALQRMAGYAPAALLQARLKAVRGDTTGALALVEQLLTRTPGNAAAWAFKGDLLALANPTEVAPALAAYRRSLELQPDLIPAHVGVMSLLVGRRDFDAAGKHLESFKKVLPQHPETQYFEAVLALSKGDAKRVRDITAGLLRGPQQDARVLLLAGQAELQLNEMTQAEALLGKALLVAPKSAPPRRMLAQVYLRTGQADKALAMLKPLLDDAKPDAGLLVLLGRAQLMAGDAKSAEINFNRAAKLRPGDQRIQASAALSRLGKGEGTVALGELEAVAAADAGTTADLALISERLRRKQFDAALKAVNVLAGKQPQMALPDFLRGRIALEKRDPADARKSFEAALAKEPAFFQAVASLAALDLGEGKPDAARGRFEAVLQRDPANVNARMALAQIAVHSGATKEIVAKLIEGAIKANPAAPGPRAALVDLYMTAGDTALALASAQSAVAAAPESPELLDRLGRVQQASGDLNQAIPTFNKMAALQPTSALPQLRLAEANMANNNPDAAAASIRRAMQAEPASLAAQRAGIALELREKRPAQALAIARTVQSQRPDEALGYLLEGEIELGQKNHAPAIAALRKALTKSNPAEVAPRLHRALVEAKQNAEADRMADSWMKAHPDDTAFALHLSALAAEQGNPVLAESRYRAVLTRHPDNVLALNNLAFLLVKEKKPGAVALAEQAVKLAPGQALFMDTLALSYAQENQIAKAVALQTRVVALAPDTYDYRLNLAKLQIQAGDNAAARAELSKLVAKGKSYAGQDEVTRVLKTLGG
jgi:putative PEP-CTERM system TPR-repeat lipoprotein